MIPLRGTTLPPAVEFKSLTTEPIFDLKVILFSPITWLKAIVSYAMYQVLSSSLDSTLVCPGHSGSGLAHFAGRAVMTSKVMPAAMRRIKGGEGQSEGRSYQTRRQTLHGDARGRNIIEGENII